MYILIIGSNGRLGKILLKIFPESTKIDIENSNYLESELQKADFAFLATPMDATINIIRRFPEYDGFIDLTSVKSKMIEFAGKIISLHPLFGPETYGTNKSIIFINDISRKDSLADMEKLFQDYKLIIMDANSHDALMGEILVKPYVLSYISKSENSSIITGSYSKFLEIEKIKYNENSQVLIDTIKYNENSSKIIKDIEKRLEGLKKLVGN
ncbi:prephenate dehydrogenase/arogenate dehydrogenase family protein [Ferroplasma sp.]|uniref:prephenate dehydrogenase/arogenate dehydrogenase family protein n=1 Tax=Ferroplasma sp. TaxID=2591003 RepID=UPI00307F5152